MKVTLSVDDDVLREAHKRAEAMGTSVNQLVREYLARFAGRSDSEADAVEFVRLSHVARGHSQGWRFNREELQRG